MIENPPPASIGDTVWFDINLNGIQDSFENGIPGVEVTLYRVDENGNEIPVSTTTTGSDGRYEFVNLPATDYFVEFKAPARYLPTLSNAGGDDTLDSDMDPTTGRTSVTTLSPGENDPTWDAGFNLGLNEESGEANLPASVGNYIWEDANQNGVQDNGEQALPGVTVQLYSISGELVATTISDENGRYLFPNLVPAVYYIEFTPPAGYLVTPNQSGDNRSDDSDVNQNTGRTNPLLLPAGQPNLELDAGFFQETEETGAPDGPQTPTSIDEVAEPGIFEPRMYLPYMGW